MKPKKVVIKNKLNFLNSLNPLQSAQESSFKQLVGKPDIKPNKTKIH